MLWYAIWMWQIQFLLFHAYHSFWSMCIRGFRMDSYVQYMIMISFLILKQFTFFFLERFCQFLPKHRSIFRNLKLWFLSDKLNTAFFNFFCNESRAPLQGSDFMVEHFSTWHSLYHAQWIIYGSGYSQQL